MHKDQLEFLIVNDPDHDFDLMMEVNIPHESIPFKEVLGKQAPVKQGLADVRKVDGTWYVSFYPLEKGYCELPWDIFLYITQKFTKFIEEMESIDRD